MAIADSVWYRKVSPLIKCKRKHGSRANSVKRPKKRCQVWRTKQSAPMVSSSRVIGASKDRSACTAAGGSGAAETAATAATSAARKSLAAALSSAALMPAWGLRCEESRKKTA